MPCNLVATITIKLSVGTLESIRNDADAMRALHTMLNGLLKRELRVTVQGNPPNHSVYFIDDTTRLSRYVMLDRNGLTLVGTFSPEQREAIQRFVEGLPAAIAEQTMVNALATQLQLIADDPVTNEYGQIVGRKLVVRV